MESQTADRRISGQAAWRWRLQVKDPAKGAQLYQRLQWRPTLQTEVYALAEKDPGEDRWADFWTIYVYLV